MIKIGDIFELKVTGGYKYFQYVFNFNEPPKYGKMFRVYTKLHKKSIGEDYPTKSEDDYFVFVFMLRDTVQEYKLAKKSNHSEGTFTSYEDLPYFRLIPPIFPGETKPERYTVSALGSRKELFFKELPKKYWKVSTLRLIPIKMLLAAIEHGWNPEREIKNILSGKNRFPY